ncbi:hypothetical protein U27_00475 [Candidatus Vecturithrix granuli]|uniref:Uncharacterized protein n=1 Tax=Vecturithrix granuli TaxID=1499967 RepID=A0A081C7M3_VECG1|nr:hypothetical protein U27_00475 [Candidatus Vecturithrix granuli]
MSGSLTRRNENQMYRETPVWRADDWCAKLEFRATFLKECQIYCGQVGVF